MQRETINRIEILDTGELLLGLEGPGEPMYAYVYREAAGVYWDPDRHGFRSTPKREWSCTQWYKHIVDSVRSGLDVALLLADHVAWSEVPEPERQAIARLPGGARRP